MRTVAALYADPRGPYPRMPGVEPWFLSRQCQLFGGHDAALYEGPHPVVAHPPCGPWSSLRHLYEGDDKALALRAVEQVRKWGGVLEHPATSRLFAAIGVTPLVVEQVAWGHVARKRTGLYLVGIPESALELPPFPGAEPTHWASGSRATPGRKRAASNRDVPPGIKVCSANQRNRTPQLFAEYLVRLARQAERFCEGEEPEGDCE